MYHRGIRVVEIILSCGLICTAFGQAHARYKQMFVFGDSYSDIGEGYLDGNGPTAVAYMAKDLGFALIPCNKSNSPKQSLDFAVSGAQTGAGKGSTVGLAKLGYGMKNQVDDFASRVNSGRIRFNPKTTLFFIAGGLNDGKLSTGTTVGNLKGEIRELYALGGRHFLVALMPTAIPAFSEVGLRLTPALAQIPEQMKSELLGATISASHWGPFFDEVMRHAAQYGITNTTDACAGREIFHEDATPCATPNAYFYYHGGHPSTAVHKVVGQKLAAEVTLKSQSK
jgi:phospholipase/lecithinase/hemolysin